jgi:hypothetical protein
MMKFTDENFEKVARFITSFQYDDIYRRKLRKSSKIYYALLVWWHLQKQILKQKQHLLPPFKNFILFL